MEYISFISLCVANMFDCGHKAQYMDGQKEKFVRFVYFVPNMLSQTVHAILSLYACSIFHFYIKSFKICKYIYQF